MDIVALVTALGGVAHRNELTAAGLTQYRIVEAIKAGETPEESTGGGTSDARFIAPLGAECIEIGPVNASIHKVDEHVRAADLEALPRLYLEMLERLLLGQDALASAADA